MARILIVEDDGDLQQLLSLAFTREGYETHYAFNGQEGYDKVLLLQPDVLVLDLMLPVLNGVEVLKRVTANTLTRDIPIVVMTAHGDKEELLERSIKAQSVREYLRKPFQIGTLLSLVRRLLAHYPRRPSPALEIAKGAVRLNKRLRTLWIDEVQVATLSRTKARLLELLLEAKGPVRREALLRGVWGKQGSASALEKTVQRLREDLGEHAFRLQTARDGYELVG
ncbi:MAG: response regulator transcription factor [Elusimicrobia bacterium]|nr:response regulator transcription factor [Elusimicrobiota bacterium]MDE2425461.1 response regulator transcription factor [Elusimicrobiota bacterium]